MNTLLNCIDYLLQHERYDDARSIINSVNDNQTKCKNWLVNEATGYIMMAYKPRILIAAGWYGYLGQMIYDEGFDDITVVDIDPKCEEIGCMLYPDIKHVTANIDTIKDRYDVVICTACEHLTDEQINRLIKLAPLCVLQSNDYYEISDHINCKKDLNAFTSSLNCGIINALVMEMDKYTRFMVIGKT